MLKKIMQAAVALTVVLGIAAATIQPANADRRGGNITAAGAIGTILRLGIAGAYAGPRYYGYYDGPACYARATGMRRRWPQLLAQQLRSACVAAATTAAGVRQSATEQHCTQRPTEAKRRDTPRAWRLFAA